MKCVGCGKEISDNMKYCKYCGTPVKKMEEVITTSENTRVCPYCGAQVRAINQFCTQCGGTLSGAALSDNNDLKKKEKKGRKKIILFVMITLLVSIGLIGVIAIQFLPLDFWNRGEIQSEEMEDSKGDEESSRENELNEEMDEEVEQKVLDMREKYNNIVSYISSGFYEKIVLEDGIVGYCDDTDVKAIVADKGAWVSDYSCFYYYDEGEVFFVYYEGEDSHRLYLEDENLIRWVYCEDAADSQNQVLQNPEDSSEYAGMQYNAVFESTSLKEKLEQAKQSGTEAMDREYILVGSDTRYITKAELDQLTKDELKLARNEIYARHGRKFDDENLRKYFEQFDWYKPTIEPKDFKESFLNAYEIANRDLIVQYEKDHGYR